MPDSWRHQCDGSPDTLFVSETAVVAADTLRVSRAGSRNPNVKRGRGVPHVSVDDVVVVGGGEDAETDLVALEEALVALARVDPRKVQIVEMRFFGGLTVEEVGEVLNVSPGTVKRDWRAAKAWLHRELSSEHGDGRGTLETG